MKIEYPTPPYQASLLDMAVYPNVVISKKLGRGPAAVLYTLHTKIQEAQQNNALVPLPNIKALRSLFKEYDGYLRFREAFSLNKSNFHVFQDNQQDNWLTAKASYIADHSGYSETTVARHIKLLKSKNIVKVEKFFKSIMDHRNFYALDYHAFEMAMNEGESNDN